VGLYPKPIDPEPVAVVVRRAINQKTFRRRELNQLNNRTNSQKVQRVPRHSGDTSKSGVALVRTHAPTTFRRLVTGHRATGKK